MKTLAKIACDDIINAKLRKEVVFLQKLVSEPGMVEAGEGKQEERVPEQVSRSVSREKSRMTALRFRVSVWRY